MSCSFAVCSFQFNNNNNANLKINVVKALSSQNNINDFQKLQLVGRDLRKIFTSRLRFVVSALGLLLT